MGYRISYENGCEKKTIANSDKGMLRKHLALIIAALLIVVASLLLRSTEVRRIILPGNGAVTEEAIKNFINSLEDGLHLGDAIAAFCQEIVQSAK